MRSRRSRRISASIPRPTPRARPRLTLIKEVRAYTGLGLKEAKELVESAPAEIKADVAKDEAESIKEKFEGVGGTALTLRAGMHAMDAETLVCLRISDSGTEGLTGDDWDEEGVLGFISTQEQDGFVPLWLKPPAL